MKSKHGKTYSTEHEIWWRIFQQCTNPKRPEYKRMGAMGIKLCDKWQTFKGFYEDMGDLPKGMNTIKRLDDGIDFCKFNCVYTFRKKGRPEKPKKQKKRRATKKTRKKIENPTIMCLTLESELLKYIKRVAIQKSVEAGYVISPNDVIRETLKKQFPILSQTDIFGDTITPSNKDISSN